MATFKFKGTEYELVSEDDLTFGEVDDMERFTATNALEGKIAIAGLIWISVRRKFPNTAFADIAREKMITVEMPDETEQEESLPPTSSGVADTQTEDVLTRLPARTASGSPG